MYAPLLRDEAMAPKAISPRVRRRKNLPTSANSSAVPTPDAAATASGTPKTPEVPVETMAWKSIAGLATQ